MWRRIIVGLVVAAAGLGGAPAAAQESAGPDEAEAPPSAPPFPPFNGPLAAETSSFNFDSPLGHVVVSGAVSGVALFTDNAVAGDEAARADLSNAMVTVQTTSGMLQAVVQAGLYSFPSLGYPYLKAIDATDRLYGPVPVAFARIVASPEFTISGGQLPTLIGFEYGFTYEDQNISRGLLWGQEPVVNRGVQLSYVRGKVAANFALTDGFFSGKLSWLTGTFTYAFDGANSLTLIAAGNVDKTAPRSSLATPTAQQNGQIYNVIFVHKEGPWTITPYIQYARTHRLPEFGLDRRAESLGAAVIVARAFPSGFSLAARGEYEATWGGDGAPNLLGFGTGADAWSLTVTPGLQKGPFFLRADLSYVGLSGIEDGLGFGRGGDRKDQLRGLLEAGVLF